MHELYLIFNLNCIYSIELLQFTVFSLKEINLLTSLGKIVEFWNPYYMGSATGKS